MGLKGGKKKQKSVLGGRTGWDYGTQIDGTTVDDRMKYFSKRTSIGLINA